MANPITVGDLVVVTLAHAKGMDMNRSTSAATVLQVYGDRDNTMLVKLTGLVPAPYDPGMVLPINGDKIRKAGW